ncbi:MAG: TetR/AcrR family transcriptional regulator [Bacillaceae bacterium]|nr:TetR/AcrR family transcriptional regulator [Bacillaceae bacterium]
MSNSKLDRRKKYTRMVLKESLMQVLKKKPIKQVTVKEICEEADINRSTFYSHYSDQYDLLNQIEEEFIHDMNETLTMYNQNKDEEAVQMTEKLLEYVAGNSDVCRTLFSENGDASFKKRVMLIASNHTVKSLIFDNKLDPQVLEYASLFTVSGSVSVIENWLETGMEKSPKELAQIIVKLTNKGLDSFVK